MLAIGLDGGTFSLLAPLAERGVMPTLAALMERGTWGTLRSTVPPVTAPAWTSFVTGKNPGKHGIYQFFSLNPLSADSLGMGQKSYLAIPGIVVDSARIPGDKLWTLVDRAGRQQVTINIPMAYPPEPVNGVMVAGMLTPPGSKRTAWPPELAARLTDYEIDLDPSEKVFSGDNAAFLRRVEETLDKRIRWTLKLMREEPWDFFMVVFTESDRLQHRFYDLLDPGLRGTVPRERRALIPAVEALYRKMDEAVAALVRDAGADVPLVILSDHGFGPAPVKLADLRVLTTLIGLARPAGTGRKGLPAGLRPTKARIYKYLKFLPQGWLMRAEAAWRRRRLRGQKAILFKMHENVGGVWINARNDAGRILDPARYAETRDELLRKLPEVLWRGEKIVREVRTREEIYHGPFLDGAPDLVFTLAEEYGILEPDMAPPAGELVITVGADRPRKKGTHRTEGMFLLAGPGIRRAQGRDAAIEDMCATILYLLGLPVPQDLDGTVAAFALEEEFMAAHPLVTARASDATAASPASAYDPEEEKAIKERLEGIGYLD